MMKRISLLLCLGLWSVVICAQDMNYTKQLVKKLSSPEFHGRGYVNSGDSIAAAYLSEEMKSIGLRGFSDNYYQSYTTSINTYPENPKLTLDGKELVSASEYIVNPNAKTCVGESELTWITKDVLTNQRVLGDFMKKDLSNSFLAIDSTGLNNKD